MLISCASVLTLKFNIPCQGDEVINRSRSQCCYKGKPRGGQILGACKPHAVTQPDNR